ncbi:MAG: hypothetical protein LQ352_005254, partial [Teloschistes flavicans]
MLGPFVCIQCRRRLLQHAQRVRNIGFVSLNPSAESVHDITNRTDDDQVAYKHNERTANIAPRGRSSRPTKRPSQRPPHSAASTDSALESLFASNQHLNSLPSRPQHSDANISEPRDTQHSLETQLSSILQRLRKQLYKDDAPLQDVWNSCGEFLDTVTKNPAAARSGSRIDPSTNWLLKDVLVKIAYQQVQGMGNTGLPRLHQAVHGYLEAGVINIRWNLVLWPYLAAIVKILYSFKGFGFEDDTSQRQRLVAELMQDVLDVWSALSRKHVLPSIMSTQNDASARAIFVQVFPQVSRAGTVDLFLEVGKATVQCFKTIVEDKRWNLEMTHDRQRIVQMLNRVFQNRTLSAGRARKHLAHEGVPNQIIDHVLAISQGWGEQSKIYTEALLPSKNDTRTLDSSEEGVSHIHQIIATLETREKKLAKWINEIRALLDGLEPRSQSAILVSHAIESDPDVKTWNSSEIHRSMTTLILDLQRATERHDVARVAAIWRRYHSGPLAKGHLEFKSREQIYLSFLSSFISLSRPEQAVHVWNDMLQANVKPNQRHWNLMLKGSAKARDPVSLEEIWRNMLAAGMEPDQPCWTTFIGGLIIGGKWQQGLRMLHDLGTHWRRAHTGQKKHVNPAAATLSSVAMSQHKDSSKPSLAPVMAAISGLTAIERHNQCLPLLDFATSHSLSLTTDIFNILLRPAVRHGDARRINNIFALMRQHNCSENEITYRILLNGHMSNTNSTFPLLSPQEQQDSVFRILDSMTAQKIPIDQKTYSTILYGLLSPKNATYNDQAARAVLEHMAKQGIKASTYIYSILVTHYFAIQPPNVPAIEALWLRIRAEKPILDREFYERMVEGYARVQSVERMLFFLRRIPHEGKAPGWRCLRVVLGTLVLQG